MTRFSDPRVDDFMMDIQSISSERYDIAVQLREFYFNCDANLSEDIKYGGLVFFHENELLGGIFFYKHHISIEFGNGTDLPDPDCVLEGKGKFRRHIKIRDPEDIRLKNIMGYIQASLRENLRG